MMQYFRVKIKFANWTLILKENFVVSIVYRENHVKIPKFYFQKSDPSVKVELNDLTQVEPASNTNFHQVPKSAFV